MEAWEEEGMAGTEALADTAADSGGDEETETKAGEDAASGSSEEKESGAGSRDAEGAGAQEFVARMNREEEEMQRENPEFDLAGEMNANPLFALMAASGLPLKRVYGFFHSDEAEGELRKRVEREVIERIRARNLRPAPLDNSGRGASRDISRMSEDEILQIDARVKRGEKVIL
jgi:hypothetical protein